MIKKKLFNFFIEILERIINKKIIYYSKNENNTLGKTAIKSSLGFWYVGDVLNTADISYGILNNGVVEKNETNLVVRILKELIKDKNICFYDIGANTGYYGILAGYLGKGKIKCYSFEPIKEYYDCLQDSIHLNRLEDIIKVFNVALSDKNGEEGLYLAGSGSSFNKNFIGKNNIQKRIVEIKKLDDVVQYENLEKPDFVKIDVEGHEYNVLLGGKRVIRQFLPILFVEIIYSLDNGFINKNYKQTLDFINNLGYRIFCLDNNKLIEARNDFKPKEVKMFLCLHPIKHKLFIKKWEVLLRKYLI